MRFLILVFIFLTSQVFSKNILVFGRGSDSISLDPSQVTDGESFSVTDNIFDTLITTKSGTTELEPALAERWTISQDGLLYTFFLRRNVTFHDETPMNADSVIFSFMRQKDPKHPAHDFGKPYIYFNALGLDKIIKDIKKIDDHTVSFELTQAEAPFLASLVTDSFAIVSPKAVMSLKQGFASHPVGTGPFVFKVWEKNQKIVLQSNKNYWQGQPKIDTLVFRSIPDNNTRLLEFLSKDIHIMDNPRPDDIAIIQEKMGREAHIMTQRGFNVGYLAMNMEKKPFDNPLVRKAVAHAINKDAIIKAIFAGQAEKAIGLLPPTLWGFHSGLKEYEYNPEKAKALLKEAGLGQGFETDIWAIPVPRPYMSDGRKVAEAIQSDLGKVGITCKIVSYEWGTYLDKTAHGEHPMGLFGWTGDIGDPDNFLYILLDKDSAVVPAQNMSFYRSEELHTLLMTAKRESVFEKRIALYQRAQEVIHKDIPVIPLVHSTSLLPVLNSVKNFQLDPTGRRRFTKVELEKSLL